MIPTHTLSSQVIQNLFLSPDDREPSVLLDYELGGVALNDPTQGLMVKVWYCRLERNGVTEVSKVYVGADDVPEVEFFSGIDITEISFTFDQNMNPFFSYIENGEAKFYWYDTVISDYTTTTLPANSRSPKCCLDDKRPLETGASDIILTYMRDDKLYFREQRDRYTVEYELASGHPGKDVLMVGMNRVNRLQWVLGLQDYPTGIVNYRVTTTDDGPRNRVTTDGSPRRLVKLSYG